METQVENKGLRARITDADEAVTAIKSGMTIAFGGYTSSGYPKAIALKLAERNKRGTNLTLNVITGANVGPLDAIFAETDIVDFRAPMIENKAMSALANSGKIHYCEQQMNKMPELIRCESFGKIDVAVIEALRITAEGNVVPTSSVGMNQHFVDAADMIIVEMNTVQPKVLDGMHDVYMATNPKLSDPIPITSLNERIGKPYIKMNPDKIRYIIHSDIHDTAVAASAGSVQAKTISENLFNFLELEYGKSTEKTLPPFQTGFGNLAAEIVHAMNATNFKDIEFFCGGLQEDNLELMVNGKVRAATTGSIQMTSRVIDIMNQYPELMKETITIRDTDITNRAETIGRFGVIALASGLEIDLYGNVNSSHISGTKVLNGLGGGANFVENAGLSIVIIPAENKNGAISAIVPMVTHQDICEHDVDIIITENGVADLRGKSEVARAAVIIDNCAGSYKKQLSNYLEKAIKQQGGHHPQILTEAFSWHERLKKTGSMKIV